MPEVISVTELNTRVRDLFARTSSLNDVWVSGEISNLKKYPSGYYFTLKDQNSEIHSVMFRSAVSRIDFEPNENMKVRAFGSIGMYVPRGTYQFIVEVMDRSGVGDRYLAFEALKKKLGEEGLFDESHKRPLPRYPNTIGVVTSQTGAVIHDIITTSATRYPANILLAPAMVQGDGAAETIVAGIELLNRQGVDVIIVGRGGGSIEDLWPFNEEIVARAIYNSQAPVVSAVGHETDFTIADFVADVRAPTPTGAAAIILRDRNEILSEIRSLSIRAENAVSSKMLDDRRAFQSMDSRLGPKRADDMLKMMSLRLDGLSKEMDSSLSGKIEQMRSRFDLLDSKLRPSRALDSIGAFNTRIEMNLDKIRASTISKMESSQMSIDAESKHLEGLNPRNVLTRGYTMITSRQGRILTSAKDIEVGESISVDLKDGRVTADVTKKEMRQ